MNDEAHTVLVVGPVDRRAAHLRRIFDCLLLVVAALSLTLAIYTIVTSNNRSDSAAEQSRFNSQQITNLQAQLAATAAQLETKRTEDVDRVACQAAYDKAATNASRRLVVLGNDLLIALATSAPAPSTQRADAIVAVLAQIKTQNDVYKVAQSDADAYDGSLPCPIPKP